MESPGIPGRFNLIRQALWRSAVVHVLKCYGDGARFQLQPDAVLKNEPPKAKIAFEFLKSLRNKHIVHDENSYAQCLPGAILNKEGKQQKIAKIVCLPVLAETLTQDNFGNLKLLVEKSRAWVISEFDQLSDRVTTKLEARPYAELAAFDSMEYRAPAADEVHERRAKPQSSFSDFQSVPAVAFAGTARSSKCQTSAWRRGAWSHHWRRGADYPARRAESAASCRSDGTETSAIKISGWVVRCRSCCYKIVITLIT
jgi:hypothetical protein